MSRDVFISYRSEDKDWAERICGALEGQSLSCWIAPRDIPAGKQWATEIVENLQKCRAFVIVLSSNSKNARQIAREAELADKTGLPIITVRVEDVQPPAELLYFLGNVQWLDAFGTQFETAMARLAQVLRAVGQGESAPAALAAAASVAPQTPGTVSTQTGIARPRSAPTTSIDAQPVSSGGMGKWLGIAAAAVVVIGVIVWFAMSHSGTAGGNGTATSATQAVANPTNTGTGTGPSGTAAATSTTAPAGDTDNGRAQDGAAAKKVAHRFMTLVKDGDLKGAWRLTSPTFKQSQPEFIKNLQEELSRDGGATGFKLGTCVYDGGAAYRCFYKLGTKEKQKDATITITRTTEWLVDKWVLTG